MKKIVETLLNLIQKINLDTILIKISKNRFLNNLVLKRFWDNKNYEYFYNKSKIFDDYFKRNNIVLKDKNILEIGSGNSIGIGYLFIKDGFKQWVASDYYRDLKKTIEEEKRIVNIVSEKIPEIKNYIKFDNTKINYNGKFSFIKLDITKFNHKLSNKFDIIISCAVFEHISKDKVSQSINNIFRYLKKGGFMIHEIDLRDHVNLKNPFYFYKYDNNKWESLTKGSIFYTNRLRAIDFMNLFKKNNLKIIELILNKDNLPKKINSYFLNKYNKDNLKTRSMAIVLKK